MNPEIVGEEQFESLLIAGARFIDVRAEIEFVRGAIPGAVNVPILDTREREQVGTCYKQQGQEAAIALGHRLVSGETRAQRTARWCALASQYPQIFVYCWRGGLRSRLAAQWIAETGQPVRLIEGGYKALRQRLLRELEAPQPREPLCIVAGRTGSAKTDLINSLPGPIDLEALACHRGSSFGRRTETPPAQIDFENALALALLRRRYARPGTVLFLEDESRQIGAATLPLDLYRAMKAAPLAVVDVPLEARVGHILREYICEDLESHLALDPEGGFERFGQSLQDSLLRIERRLGRERLRVAQALMRDALQLQERHADASGHRAWIELLLSEYYDPMYEYQLLNAAERVVFRGDFDAVREWCLNATPAVLAP